MSQPFMLGQTVLYRLSEFDINRMSAEINDSRVAGNRPMVGAQYPAQVVAVFGPDAANLKVALDGDYVHLWVTSRTWGDDPGSCQPLNH